MVSTTRCLIGVGSNLGDRGAVIHAAIEQLTQTSGITNVVLSSLHETAPVGGPAGQPPFLNAAITLESSLPPLETLAVLQHVEQQAGRERHIHWGARTLDLDLLLYGDAEFDDPALSVPHPRMSFRRFVLASAVEIAADWRHPTSGWTLAQLWRHLHDSPRIVVLLTHDTTWASTLAASVQRQLHELPEPPEFELWIRPPTWDSGALRPRLIVTGADEPQRVTGPQLRVRRDTLAEAIEDVAAAIVASHA
ncbi:MAG: 2-amino-4-hydroxy-6-hydroxymethyldihydropteridine diphosphokinase [Planctomycetaceae bacterium]|nr:2-amino-4-hydroxy-6-hydroxymethyldihydropteridine diphosphokinase [Planctomycetaceae bacterium]